MVGVASVAVVATMATMFASGAAAAGGSLTGAGSTLVAPLVALWSSDYKNRTGNSVVYGAVGSGAGIAQITARTVDFGASDAPFSPSQASGCNGCVQIPWGLTATGVAFRLDGVSKLNVSGAVLAGIYLGTIQSWDDAQIKKLNPGVTLPALKITPAFRSDGSGDTYAFTNFLTDVSATWKQKIGVSTSVSFPAGVGGKGNAGVAAVVSSTNGAIGYIAASFIISHNLNAAAVQNAAGQFEYPNIHNISAAGNLVKKVGPTNELHIVNPPARSRTAYPISTFTYVLVPKASKQKTLLTDFITYALTNGQSFGPRLDFAPLPKVVVQAAKKTVATLQQG